MAIQAKELKILVISDYSYRTVQALEVARRLASDPPVFLAGRNAADIIAAHPSPDMVIGAGEKTTDLILEIKKSAKNRCRAVAILDPRKNREEFDLIAVPGYEPHPKGENILETTGIINHINKKFLSKTLQDFSENNYLAMHESGLFPPYLTLLIGGKHIGGNITGEDAVKLAELVNKFASKNNAAVLIATCKRTEKATVEALKNAITAPNFFYDYNRSRDIPNPYILFLALAQAILVTGDSLRMCSEACSAGKQVFIYGSENIAFRYKSLHEELFAKNYARPHFELNSTQKPMHYLDEAGRVAEFIESQLF